MKYCSECGSELFGELAHTEDGQEDYDWCKVCVDYCDALERIAFQEKLAAIESTRFIGEDGKSYVRFERTTSNARKNQGRNS